MRDWKLMPVYLAKMVGDASWFKGLSAAAVVICQYVFGDEVLQKCALGALGLMVLDTVTGAIVAKWYSVDGWQSAKLSRVLVKGVSYGSAILVAATVPRSIPGMDWSHGISVGLALAAIVCTEGLSICENIDKLGFKSMGWLAKFLRGRLSMINRAKPFELETKE